MRGIAIVSRGILRKGRGIPLSSRGFLVHRARLVPVEREFSLVLLYITKKITELFILGVIDDDCT